MKRCLILNIIFLFFAFVNLLSVDFHDFDTYQHKLTYQEVEQRIKSYLEKDSEIRNFYKLTPQKLYIGDLEHQQIDYVLHLNENVSITPRLFTHKLLKGAKIAIDPGHFGGQFAELEERFIKIPSAKTKNGQGIYFCEGDLTYLTAVRLKQLLEDEGAIVFLTRAGIGKGALEEDFFAWMKRHPEFKSKPSSKVFREYYNREDLRKRAEKINAFSPDITVIIHYNAHLTAEEKKAKVFFTKSNYNLAFIPGAFSLGELKEEGDRYEFLRLLLTDNIRDSLNLSRYVAQEFVRQLDVPLITQKETASYIERACLMQEQGIYCRNLALTRLIHSPLCYGETLIQNNEDEVYRLASEDIFIMDIPCSNRVESVARAYFEGIKTYFRPFQ